MSRMCLRIGFLSSISKSVCIMVLLAGGCSNSSDDSTAVDVPATKELMSDFRAALMRWSSIESGTPRDLRAMLGSAEVVIAGELGPTAPGRKAFAGEGAYDSYANLQVRNVEVLKGSLERASNIAYVERPWPNNVPLDALVETTPVGARVIIIADAVDDAREQAAKLNADALRAVRPNLLAPAAYGLLIEDIDGDTHAPLWESGPLLVSGAEVLTRFDDALAAIRAAAAAR